MVPEIVFRRRHPRVHRLEVLHAGQLVVVGLLLGHDRFLLAGGNPQLGQHRGDFLNGRMLVGTTVVLVGVRGVAIYDLGTRVGWITLPFSFLSVHVAEVVGILLVEVLARKHSFEVRQCVFQGQSGSLQEQTVLQPPPVFQVLFSSQGYLELGHAQRHVLQVGRDGVGGQVETVRRALALEVIVLLGVYCGNVLKKPGGALQRRGGRNSTQQGQLAREVGAEFGGHQAQQLGLGNVGPAGPDKDLPVLNQVQRLRERDPVDVLLTAGNRQGILVQARRGGHDVRQEGFQLALGQDVGVRQDRFQGPRDGVGGLAVVEAVFQQGHFLRQDPPAKVLRPAVGQSQDKVRDSVFRGIVQFRQERVEVFLVLVRVDVAELELLDLFENL
mmetsp:Transcript_26493/g.56773  ORF Transcript_26493/g.56773 Transcript_26493/m.56773 type:complete len:385 (+) Transcript_26493:281-1435(+)